MTTDLLTSTPNRRSVRRCLFGKPDKDDEFTKMRKQVEHASFLRFKRKWNFDDEDSDNSEDMKWFHPDSSDIPEFYTRGYPRKCMRRAVTRCVGKQLPFMGDSEEENSPFIRSHHGEDSDIHTPIVQYVNASTGVEVLIGVRLSPQEQPPSPIVAPTPVRCRPTTQSSTTSPPPSPVRLSRTRSVSQPRLTDLWPIRKRARSLTPDVSARHPKRDRMESL